MTPRWDGRHLLVLEAMGRRIVKDPRTGLPMNTGPGQPIVWEWWDSKQPGWLATGWTALVPTPHILRVASPVEWVSWRVGGLPEGSEERARAVVVRDAVLEINREASEMAARHGVNRGMWDPLPEGET